MVIEIRDEGGNVHFHIPPESRQDLYECGGVRFKGQDFRFGGISNEMIYFIPVGNTFNLPEDWQIVGGVDNAGSNDQPAA